MKTTTVLLLLTGCVLHGQSERVPPQRPGLRVALDITTSHPDDKAAEAAEQIRTVLTRELRKLGDVRVTSPYEAADDRLHVTVAGGMCTTVFVVATRPSGGGETFAKDWVLGGNAKQQWVSFVQEFDQQVLEADRRRLFR